ncbi:MAG: MerR family transcriptional regulator [Candidatus Omnitrophica bacterium]|nr:MerR family transcriptional regulator [Candidatus Omnitrophota bacterium]MCF7894105.1 MerR family transcriptional regulator [Candidatus Omnitrophota bacterium]
MAKNKYYTIQELSKELGISKETIKRYEKKGIFPKSSRNPINHWRRYSLKRVRELKKILGQEE